MFKFIIKNNSKDLNKLKILSDYKGIVRLNHQIKEIIKAFHLKVFLTPTEIIRSL